MVTGVSECKYSNGLPVSYMFASLYPDKTVLDVLTEEYIYGKDGLEEAYVYEFLPYSIFGERDLLTIKRYSFEHDPDGYLSKYSVCEYKDDCETFTVDIDIKRKI